MATLGVAAGGAGVGFLLGGPFGASVGWIAGTIVGRLLFGSDGSTVEGPRLNDFTVATSYGKVIKKGYGTGRVTLDLIWLKGNKFDEVEETESSGGKGLSGGTKTKTRSYFATFTASAGEGPASGVRRLWADRKLIYDATGNSEVTRRSSLNFTFYPGDEVQLPDPDYAADVGAANAVGMRGICYLKFLDLPLADYGNRIPTIEAEIVYVDVPPQNNTQTGPTGLGLDDNSRDASGASYRHNIIWISDRSSTGGLAVYDLDTLAELHRVNQPNPTQYANGSDADGNLIGDNNVGSNLRISPVTFENTYENASPGAVFSRYVQGFKAVTTTSIWRAIGGLNTSLETLATGTRFWLHNELALHSTYQPLGANTRPRSFTIMGENTGRLVYKVFDSADATVMHFYLYQIVGEVLVIDNVGFGIQQSLLGTVDVTDIDPNGTSFTIEQGTLSHDRADDSLVTFAKIDNDDAKQYVFKWRAGVGVIWKTLLPQISSGILASEKTNGTDNRLAGFYYAWENSNNAIFQVNLGNGVLAQAATGLAPSSGYSDNNFYDDTRSILFAFARNNIYKTTLNLQASGAAQVAEIYKDRCRRAGIDVDTELDVSAITETIPFYLIDRPNSERSNIEPLIAVYRHAAATEDRQLRFANLGVANNFVLNERDMEPTNNGDPAELTQISENELPARISLNFMDIAADYQQATQAAQLITDPVKATRSTVTNSINLPGALDVSEARQMADRLLTNAWLERDNYKGRPSIEFLEFTPGLDAGTLKRLDGSSQRIRPLDISLGADWSIQASFVSEDSADFALDTELPGDSGRLPDQTIPADVDSELFLLNTTVLRDVDLTDRSISRGLWAGSPVRDVTWPGANLFVSSGGENTDLGNTPGAIAYGVLATVPPADDEPWVTNIGSTFEAQFVVGFEDLQSTTYLDMLNGGNSVYVFKAATGEGEVISFQDFTDLGNKKAQFTTLIRGRRGTELYMDAHAAGDIIVVLDRPKIADVTSGLSDINVQYLYRLVTVGRPLEDATIQSFSYIGQDLKPWAVAQISASPSGVDILIDWVRRTRANGGLRDGTGTVPLNEDTEEYELEVYDAPGGNLVATYTGLTTSSFTYTEANWQSDLGLSSMPTDITVKIYQISAQVGRGFSSEVTVDVV